MAIRKRTTAMTAAERGRFIRVMTQLYAAPNDPNPYGKMVEIHGDMSHNMHAMNAVGAQRFLPWHRVYLLKLEKMGQAADPLFFIPYWDWTTERAVPAWLVPFRPTAKVTGTDVVVQRNPAAGTLLPTQAAVRSILLRTTYTRFTIGSSTSDGLENGPHNFVHGWVRGTMSFINVAPSDPLFWLHHAQVDRLWSLWQVAHPGLNPSLGGPDRRMDPWPETEAQVRSIASLGYSYGA